MFLGLACSRTGRCSTNATIPRRNDRLRSPRRTFVVIREARGTRALRSSCSVSKEALIYNDHDLDNRRTSNLVLSMRDTEATIIEFYVSNLVPGPQNLDKFDGESRSRFSRSRTLWTDRTWNARRCRRMPRRSVEERNDFLRSRGYFAVTTNTRARFSELDHRTQKSSIVSVRLRSRDKVFCLRFEIGVNPCFRRSLFLRRVIVITTVAAITSARRVHHTAQSRRRTRPVQKVARIVFFFFYCDRRRRCSAILVDQREKKPAAVSRSCAAFRRRVSSRRLAFVSSFDRVRPWIRRLTIDDYKRRWMATCVCSGTQRTRLASRNAARLCLRRRKSSRKLFKWRARVVLLESEPMRLRLRGELVTLAESRGEPGIRGF